MATPQEKKTNPASEAMELPKGYRPMSVGQLRLEVPEKNGWHRHWFRGTSSRLARAQQAGYRFVDPEEVDPNNFDLAGDSESGGSTDLGTRVSVISGDEAGKDGQPGRLYLMECPDHIFVHAQGILQETVDNIAEQIKGGTVGIGQTGENRKDMSQRYLKDGKTPSLFNRK